LWDFFFGYEQGCTLYLHCYRKKKPYFLDKEFKLSIILDQTIEKLVSQCGEITKEMFESALGSAWSFWMIPVGCCHLSVCMLLSLK
jgi:hypothetical protein